MPPPMSSVVAKSRMVPTAATVGSASRVIEVVDLHGQRLEIRVGDEQRDDDFVEGCREGEEQARQHPRRDERQGHRTKRGERSGAEACGSRFQPPVKDFEIGGDGDQDERHRQDGVGKHESDQGADKLRVEIDGVDADGEHDTWHDHRRQQEHRAGRQRGALSCGPVRRQPACRARSPARRRALRPSTN